MKDKKLELKYVTLGLYRAMCPSCKTKSLEFWNITDSIEVNIESKGFIHIPKWLSLTHGCNNPICEWSKVKGEFQDE